MAFSHEICDSEIDIQVVEVSRHEETDIYKALHKPLLELVQVYKVNKTNQYWTTADLGDLPLEQLVDEAKVTGTEDLRTALATLKTNPGAVKHGILKFAQAAADKGVKISASPTDSPLRKAGAQVLDFLFQSFIGTPTKLALATANAAVESTTGLTVEMQTCAALELLEKIAPATKIQHIIGVLDCCFQVYDDENYDIYQAIKTTSSHSEKHAPSKLTLKRSALGTNFEFESAFYYFCLAAKELIENIAHARGLKKDQKEKVLTIEEQEYQKEINRLHQQHAAEKNDMLEAHNKELVLQANELTKQIQTQLEERHAKELQEKAQQNKDLEGRYQELNKQLQAEKATVARLTDEAAKAGQPAPAALALSPSRILTTCPQPEQSLVKLSLFKQKQQYNTGIFLTLAAGSAAGLFYFGLLGTAWFCVPVAFFLAGIYCAKEICKTTTKLDAALQQEQSSLTRRASMSV